MNIEKEDFYIAMLRFGLSKLESGFRVDELAEHLHSKGYQINSENSILLHHYFPQTFFAKSATSYPDLVSFYFLKPEAYFHLLNYDNMLESRKNAKQTKLLSVIAILVALFSIAISIFKK